MKWPWVSRKAAEEELNFYKGEMDRRGATTDSALRQTAQILALYEAEVMESQVLRAEANTMLGILTAHKIKDGRMFGPYFNENGQAITRAGKWMS